jgi:hypothetical protein
LTAALLGWFGAAPAIAFEEPPVNLGLTTFLDGAPPPGGPGLYFQDFVAVFTSTALRDDRGNKVRIGPSQSSRVRTRVPVHIPQLIYLSPRKILGANLGITALLPMIVGARTDDPVDGAVRAQDGIGDLIIGPILQFQPVINAEGPVFSQRFELDFVIPTGKLSQRNAINPGVKFYSFNPYWAATLWLTSRWTASWRLHYLWNSRSSEVPDSIRAQFGPEVDSFQAGQAFHANFATDFALRENLRLGLNGYYFNQFEDTKIDGKREQGRRERVTALGPGLFYALSEKNAVFLNTYFEQNVKNRPDGNRFVLRWIHKF